MPPSASGKPGRTLALQCSAAHAQVSAQIMHKGCAAQAAGILIEGSVLILDGPAVYDRYGPVGFSACTSSTARIALRFAAAGVST
jgi:hypothetical protein